MYKKGLFCLSIILCLLLLLVSGCNRPKQVGEVAPSASSQGQGAMKQEKTTPDKSQSENGEEKDVTSGNADISPNGDDPKDKEVKGESPGKKDVGQKLGSEKPVTTSQPARKTAPGGERVSLLVTRDFGKQVLAQEKPIIKKNETVLEALEALVEVNTGYDGGLVIGINGLENSKGGLSGQRHDWFFFVNGTCADVGARDYVLQVGDSVWWDYHCWESMGLVNSAVIGSYPEPFIHGYRGKVGPTTIMTHSSDIDLATELQKSLKAQGVASVSVKELDEKLLQQRQGPVIVVGEWNQLKAIPWLEKLNKAYRKNGTCVHFTDGGLELLDYRGKAGQTITGSAGVIAASGEGLGDESPLWLVIGTDREGLQQAVDILVNHPESIQGLYSAAVVSGKIVRLPQT